MIKEAIKTEYAIEEAMEKFAAAWNAHDPEAFANTFVEDADLTNVFGQKIHGRQEIEQVYRQAFTTMFKESYLVLQEISVRIIGPDLAAVDVFWNMNGSTDWRDKPLLNRKGLLNLVMKQEKEAWLILLFHNMDLPSVSFA